MAKVNVDIKRKKKIQFDLVAKSNPQMTIPMDFEPPMGDGECFAGLELLLMSFAGCVSTVVVVLLEGMKKNIDSFSAKAEGTRSDEPMALTDICLILRVESKDITEEDMKGVIAQTEAISPVWLAIKNNVDVKIDYEIV